MTQATRNAQDGVSLIQTAEGEITRVSKNTEFNNKSLLSGNNTFSFQIGVNAGQTLSMSISDMSASLLGTSNLSLAATITDTESGQKTIGTM